jgi:hypothetical protein
MSDFKIGDRVVITGKTYGYQGRLKVGDTAHILEFYSPEGKNVSASMVADRGASYCNHSLDNIELKPKWTIYNNTLPWSELSDKQKGQFLLASHEGVRMSYLGVLLESPSFKSGELVNTSVYIARELVKSEPTMAELFVSDWKEQENIYKKDVAEYMIAKGWKK